jgi:hypothetical protein
MEGFPMHLKLLADTLTAHLAPALAPFLGQGGLAAAQMAPRPGDEGSDLALRLWQRLRPVAAASCVFQAAVEEAAGAPGDIAALAMLRLQLHKILAADANLAGELARILDEG